MLKLTLRNLIARKVRLVMSTLAIVLGIGFLAGVMTFSNGLGATFDSIVEGSTSDGLVRPAGELSFTAQGAGTEHLLTPKTLEKVAGLPEVERASGTVEGRGTYLLGEDGKLVGGQGAPTLVYNNTPDPNMAGEQIMELAQGDWPEDGEVTLDSSAAERGGYQVGDTVTLLLPFGETQQQFTLSGIANFNGGGTAGAILVLMDTEQSQRLFLGGKDLYTAITLTAADGVSQQQLADAVSEVLPKGFTAVTGDTVVEESQNQINQFLNVIDTFLITFAVIAIVVGAFIIANTFTILVAQRVRELALLRALGAGKKQVTRSVLLEAAVMALVGATIGIAVGLALARALAALFRFIGLDVAGDVLTLTPLTVLLAYVVALVVTLASAYFPARRAAKVPPVAAMRDDLVVQESSLGRRALLGTLALVVGAALAVMGLLDPPGNDAIWIGAAAVIWVVTVAVMAPIIGQPVLKLFRTVFAKLFGTTGRLAGENALRNPRRTGATASALMIGLAIVSAVGVLAASLSSTSDQLVDEQFTTDFLVSSPNFQGFPVAIGNEMEKVDGVGSVSRQQASAVLVNHQQDYVFGVDDAFWDQYDLTLVSGTLDIAGKHAVVQQSKARELMAGVGDTITIEFPGGESYDVEVAGIIEDTPVVSGVTLPLDLMGTAGLKRNDNSVSINLAPEADKAQVQAALEKVVEDQPIVTVQDKEQFGDSIKAQVNQLLYMIYGLLALAIVIAVIGIVNTLGLSVIERTREIGLLRAVGLSRARLRRMITLESVVIALLGAVLGMAVGLLVGVLLRQSLKDDITVLSLPLVSLVVFLGVAVVFGVVAAIVPAVRASRMKVLDAIAFE